MYQNGKAYFNDMISKLEKKRAEWEQSFAVLQQNQELELQICIDNLFHWLELGDTIQYYTQETSVVSLTQQIETCCALSTHITVCSQ